MLRFLLPQRCIVCGDGGVQVCDACLDELPRLGAPMCERCGAPTVWPVARCLECAGRRLAFARARAAVAYVDAVRTFVTAWKEQGLRRLARAAAEVVAATLERPAAPLVAVPPDPDRNLWRPQHPAGALGQELAAVWNVPLLDVLARRTGARSRRQRGLPLDERRRNVRGAFVARGRSPARIVLVDDVYTSGATANAAASALRAAGARRVDVVTFARAVRGYYSESRSAQGGRVATSGEGQEPRDQRIDPRPCGAEAVQARPPPR